VEVVGHQVERQHADRPALAGGGDQLKEGVVVAGVMKDRRAPIAAIVPCPRKLYQSL
jgi:hypothetical protein